jgi:hypothetical protein
MAHVRFVTSIFARQAGLLHDNGGFVSALYQMAEAASLRLSPRPVLDRVNAAARLALRLPPAHDRSRPPGACDAMHSVRAWSLRAQSPFLWMPDVQGVSYAQNMLIFALDSEHSDQNAILAFLHRLKIWDSWRPNLGKSRMMFRNLTMSMITSRDLLHAAWPDLDVDAPRSLFANLSADSLPFGQINVLGFDFGFLRNMIWAFRRRGECSRAIATFGFFIDKINESIAGRTAKSAPRRPLFYILESMAAVLLSGGSIQYELRVFPPALVEFLTRWTHVLARGVEPDSDRLGLEGLDPDVCARVFASTAALHAHVRSDVLFDVMIGSMRALLVVRCTHRWW